jgi:hypothetical protein
VVFLWGLYLFVLPLPAEQKTEKLFEIALFGANLTVTFFALKLVWLAVALGSLSVSAVLFAFYEWPQRAMAIADALFKRLPERIAHALRGVLNSFVSGLAVLKAPVSELLAVAGQSLLLWSVIAAGFYLNNVAFGISLPPHSCFLLIAFLTFGVAIPTPGSVGGFHYAYKLALTAAFVGVSPSAAVAAGLSGHALGNLPVLVIGLICLGREGLTMGRVTELAGAQEAAADKPAEVQA